MSDDWVTDEARLLNEIKELMINILSELQDHRRLLEEIANPK